jgi:hypothetical protein
MLFSSFQQGQIHMIDFLMPSLLLLNATFQEIFADVPGWNERCDDLYDEYNLTHDRSLFDQLLQDLNDQRKKKWKQKVESADFTHPSRKAWKLLRDLGSDTQMQPPSTSNVSANNIATRLLHVLKVSMDQHHVRTTKRALCQRRREMSGNTELFDDFTIEKVELAFLSVKPGKAAGFDGVHPEFIRNSGRKTKEWLVTFFMMTVKLPKIFKRSKVIAILKPRKNGSDAAHYRPISLLSVVYKLLERPILQRIEPLIDAVTQAGF